MFIFTNKRNIVPLLTYIFSFYSDLYVNTVSNSITQMAFYKKKNIFFGF